MNKSQGEYGIRRGPGLQTFSFATVPPLVWTRISRIHKQSLETETSLDGSMVTAIQRSLIKVKPHDVPCPAIQRGFRIFPRITPKIPYKCGLNRLGKFKNELFFRFGFH